MKCYYHSDREAAGRCVRCGRALCQDCIPAYGDVLCGNCISEIEAERQQAEAKQLKRDLTRFWIATAIGVIMMFGIMCQALAEIPRYNISVLGFIWTLSIYMGVAFLTGSGIIYGWEKISDYMNRAGFILILPIMGWLIYFGLKLCGAVFVGWIYYIKELLRLKDHLRKQGEQVQPYIDKAKSYLNSEDIKAQKDVLVRKGEETMDNIRKKLQSDS